jgi:hypothetical protein
VKIRIFRFNGVVSICMKRRTDCVSRRDDGSSFDCRPCIILESISVFLMNIIWLNVVSVYEEC